MYPLNVDRRGQLSQAFGKPGIEPRWTHGNKDGVGTAYNSSSQIWFTLLNGILTEIYYPTVDRPQVRDLQFLVSDGDLLFHEEKRHLVHSTAKIDKSGLAYRIVNSDPDGRYEITKEVITDPHSPVILVHTVLSGSADMLEKLKLYVLCAPHLEVGGKSNNGNIVQINGRKILVAEKSGTFLAIGATVPFNKVSCGYVGSSDGWTDISANHKMTFEFDTAEDGNIALTGELDLSKTKDFVLALAMGNSLHSAVTRLFQSLSMNFDGSKLRYLHQWARATKRMLPLKSSSHDGGKLYRSSYEILLAHEDKTYEGALIASMSIPWGEVAGDDDRAGYHLVWTRDLCNSALAALAAGNIELPLRALIYLSVSQLEDGSFAQNFWIDGTPYWHGIQLDEASFPILLAWRLRGEGALKTFDPYMMVLEAARFIVTHGPVTQQERWEEASGYSPSTLAANIAALVCAAAFAREEGDQEIAGFLEDYADFLECHIESWTVTAEGSVAAGIKRHYIRIRPADINDSSPQDDPNSGTLHINNIPSGEICDFPAKDIVDGGFLELVRYGIRSPDDPVIVDSVKAIDELLKTETPEGPCWHRYNHDGYGQRDDGTAYQVWGRGRLWPLLTGERGHYELSLGRDPSLYVRTMENFSAPTGLIPEQVWDAGDIPEKHMYLGRETGSARPLVWAHAEYIKLLRSAADRRVFDRLDIVEERYIRDRSHCRKFEIWKPNRKITEAGRDFTLRVQAPSPFTLHWSDDGWKTVNDTDSVDPRIGLHYVDFDISDRKDKTIVFTFFWPEQNRWEGMDYSINIL